MAFAGVDRTLVGETHGCKPFGPKGLCALSEVWSSVDEADL